MALQASPHRQTVMLNTYEVFDPNKVRKTGWLEKMGGSVHTWKKRFFALTPTAIYYFKDQNYKDMLGTIPILKSKLTKEPETDGPGFYFNIKIPAGVAKRTDFLIKAPSEEERYGWMNEILKLCIVPVFKNPLTNALMVNPHKPGAYIPIPFFFAKAVKFLEESYLDTEGIYRMNGSQAKIETYVAAIDENANIDFSEVHSTTGVVKLFMRSLPEPIMLFENQTALRAIASMPEASQVESMRSLVSKLPIPNYLLLAYMFAHLRKVLEHEETNKMNMRAISVCFGPSLIWGQEDTGFGDSELQLATCTILMLHYDDIFGNNPMFRYGSKGTTTLNKVIDEQDAIWPYTLDVPVGSIVQTVAEDKSGWTICVWNDRWGAVHKKSLTPVTTNREIVQGLAKQTLKWKLDSEYLVKMGSKCPEAVQLYEVLLQKVTQLREQANKLA